MVMCPEGLNAMVSTLSFPMVAMRPALEVAIKMVEGGHYTLVMFKRIDEKGKYTLIGASLVVVDQFSGECSSWLTAV